MIEKGKEVVSQTDRERGPPKRYRQKQGAIGIEAENKELRVVSTVCGSL
jgi:hypothetical protein